MMAWTSGGWRERLIAFVEEMVQTCDEIDALEDREIAAARLYHEVQLRLDGWVAHVPDEVRADVLRAAFDR